MSTTAQISDTEISELYSLYLRFREDFLRDSVSLCERSRTVVEFFSRLLTPNAFRKAFLEMEMIAHIRDEIIYQLKKGYAAFKSDIETLMAETEVMVFHYTDGQADCMVCNPPRSSSKKRLHEKYLYPWGMMGWFAT